MSVKFLADENFNNSLIRVLRHRVPNCDVIRAQDVGLSGKSDPIVLEWAAKGERIVLTHDADTMIAAASERTQRSLPMAGVIVIRGLDYSAAVAEDLVLAAQCGTPDDFRDVATFLPF